MFSIPPLLNFLIWIVEKYSDVLLGLYIVRGDNIVVMGEIDVVKEVWNV